MSQRFSDTIRTPAAVARFFLVAAAGLALDLFTKWWAFHKLLLSLRNVEINGQVTYFATSRSYDLIPNWLRFEVTVNQGAVFGIGQGQRVLFLLVSAAAVIFLVYLFLASKPRQWFYQIVLGMLLAGVLGNVYDRVVFGYVRDMIHALPGWMNPLRGAFPSWQYVFPWIFNIADSLLCVGVTLMLVYTLFAPAREPDKKPAAHRLEPDQPRPESQRA